MILTPYGYYIPLSLYTVIGKKSSTFSENKSLKLPVAALWKILDMEEYKKTLATMKLMSELEKGELSAWEKDWTDLAEIKREFLRNK